MLIRNRDKYYIYNFILSKWQEVADIAVLQARTLEQQQVMREKEFQSMRGQLLDLQSQTEEKALIGKLHRHIIQLQISEGLFI